MWKMYICFYTIYLFKDHIECEVGMTSLWLTFRTTYLYLILYNPMVSDITKQLFFNDLNVCVCEP